MKWHSNYSTCTNQLVLNPSEYVTIASHPGRMIAESSAALGAGNRRAMHDIWVLQKSFRTPGRA